LLDIIDEGNLSLSELLDAIEYKTPVSALLAKYLRIEEETA
jgi:hypothetical protein